ncbi:MAG: zinc-dependent metalloprotease [Candidatus Eremiobacteraeota bacterium]|nr:zinc-dependent metalloprotease [Candidatus Eremiobacteraeota bacterium]
MHIRSLVRLLTLIAVLLSASFLPAARADDADTTPAPYAKFTAGAQSQTGLFTLWRKNGKVYVELSTAQLGKDFVQSAAPANGLGGWGIVWGEDMFAQTRLIRFTRQDNKIVISWPNTFFKAPEGSARARSVQLSFSPSVVAVTPIVAEDSATGKIIFDGAPFLTDVLNMTAVLKAALGTTDPAQTYKLDTDRTYFGPTKAFPENVIIESDETFEADAGNTTVDTVPDSRSIQLRIMYNIAQPPDDKDYMPRLYDARLGFVASPYLKYGDDRKVDQNANYIVRWNMQPSDPTKPISPAKHPMIFWLSNTIPDEYRPTVRDALLTWNKAFEKVGISQAVQVRDQPDDPNWDPDDIRYNVVRWVTEAYPSFGAEAQWVYDPRTGELFHTGILLDAVEGYGTPASWEYYVTATRSTLRRGLLAPQSYAMGKFAENAFGRVALTLMDRMDAQTQHQYTLDSIRSTVLHESGHDMGFQHNFIAAIAYSAKNLQSMHFTQSQGVATSVMHYAPLNLWPKHDGQGTYWQTVLGPYDYYAIRWGYARIPGARTPEDEVPTLNRWAGDWSKPDYMFASDEDVSWANGHAVDPRVEWFNLTNDTLGWCGTQLGMTQSLMHVVDQRWPQPGHAYEQERNAYGWLLVHYLRCDDIALHFIGGEYLSRAHKGDPGASLPLQPVPRSQEQRAFALLNQYLFSESAWHYRPSLLNSLVYTEEAPIWGGLWAYNPPIRHDIPIVELAGDAQQGAIAQIFQPIMLQRLDDLAMRSTPGQTMSLADLFDWTQSGIYGDLHTREYAPSEVRRNLQQWYARYLIGLWLRPDPATPYDAQSLARLKLVQLQSDVRSALTHSGESEITRAHLQALDAVVSRALDTRNVVPMVLPSGS